MKFSLNFVKEFFDPKKPAEEIAALLTMSGLEIEHIEEKEGDVIFDAEVTSNRYDWLSLFGIARELACVCNRHLEPALPAPLKKPPLRELDIVIENLQDCPVYIGRLIRNVTAGSSPAWLKERIVGCGINSVNNIVDSTNYCMLKWGNPLHAFDLDKIEGNVYIRRAKNGESFLGLDDKEYTLTTKNLVISDAKKVIALAGVLGAKNTEVDAATKHVLLEAAVFSPLTIRRSRRSVGLSTESSYRFERNVSGYLLDSASHEAAQLICTQCGGSFCGYAKRGRVPLAPRKKIAVSLSRLQDYIGQSFSKREVSAILKHLGCEVTGGGKDTLKVLPSPFRLDIESDVDVFEEITRIYGYGRIKETLPVFAPQYIRDNHYRFKKELRNFLVNLGLHEVITYSITSEESLHTLKEADCIRLTNPLRNQENALRTTLLTGMLDVVRYNLYQRNQQLRLFEVADIYRKTKASFAEVPCLGIAVTERSGGFFVLKGIVQEALQFLHISGYALLEKSEDNFLNSLEIIYNHVRLGSLGKLNDVIQKKFDLNENVYSAQLDLAACLQCKGERLYKPFSRYPVMFRDISMHLGNDSPFREVEKILQKEVGEYLADYRVVDVYTGKEVPKGFCAFTLRVFYSSQQRTLTSEEVDSIHHRVRERLSSRKDAFLR